MIADSKEELHRMAQRLGLRRSYFQEHATLWHYDLTPRKRDEAIKLGAIPITRKQMAERLRATRLARLERCKLIRDLG